MTTFLPLLIQLAIIVIVAIGVFFILAKLKIGEPYSTILQIVLVVVVICVAVWFLLGLSERAPTKLGAVKYEWIST